MSGDCCEVVIEGMIEMLAAMEEMVVVVILVVGGRYSDVNTTYNIYI